MAVTCSEYERLKAIVENALGNFAQITTLQLALFRLDDLGNWKDLDKRLELTIGEKERAIAFSNTHEITNVSSGNHDNPAM